MAKFKGQKVVVVDTDKIYPTYHNWATDNKLSMSDPKIRELWAKYLSSDYNNCELGTFLTVVAMGHHSTFKNTIIYLCEDSEGDPVLIDEEGLDSLVENTSKLKWTDLKIGDIIKHKVHGYKYMITGIDSNLNVGNHVFVADDWIDDDKLAELWEKVEE